MANTIKTLRASASGNVPASLAAGQFGIDEFLGKFFWHQNSGTVTAFPLLAPANTFLANTTGTSAAPTYITNAAAMTALGAAPLASPNLTGVPVAPTASAGTNTTQLATTAFVTNAVTTITSISASTVTPIMDGTGTVGTSTAYARADHIHPSDTTRATLVSPTFTGVPAGPTATAGTNTTQLSTCAFVTTAVSTKAPLASPTFTGVVNIPVYTVANLPTSGNSVGSLAYASNGRANTGGAGLTTTNFTTQAAGAGTGVLVTWNGSVWQIVGTNATVTA